MNNQRHSENPRAGPKRGCSFYRQSFYRQIVGKVLFRRLAVGAIALIIPTLILLSQPRWLFHFATHLMPGALYAIELPDSHKIIALTIDDGPSTATANILAILEKHNVKATFFNISTHLPGHEAIVQQAVSSGHELGNHLTTDFPSIRLSPAAFEASLLSADQALSPFLQAARQTTNLQWLRPGMGFYNQTMVRIAQRHGYRLVLGSVFPYDTHLPFSRFASTFILNTVQPGDIIVLHDGLDRGKRTARTLTKILPVLQARGYTITTVTELTASK